jgi:hypothetical protein
MVNKNILGLLASGLKLLGNTQLTVNPLTECYPLKNVKVLFRS